MIKIIESSLNGFCPGVTNAIKLAKQYASPNTYCLNEISHNEQIINDLKQKGIKFIKCVEELDNLPSLIGVKVIIRSHGEGREIYQKLSKRGVEIIDATCTQVKKIHQIVEQKNNDGYKIVILGNKEHPEVKGICGWCNDSLIIDENSDLSMLKTFEKVCVVCQTTFLLAKYEQIIEKIKKEGLKTVEIFDTICYTTSARQKKAQQIAKECDLVLIIGSEKSSNTKKLFEIADKYSKTYLISTLMDLNNVELLPDIKIGVISGASTPKGLIMEVVKYMSLKASEVSVSEELKAGVEESLISYREGKRVKGTVIASDDKGIRLNIGGKYDGIIYAVEAGIEKEYSPEDYPVGLEIEAMIIGRKDSETDCILLSKKKVDLIKEGDKVIESIRGGETFELLASSVAKGGLLGKLGTYTVFIPSSQIRENGYPKDLNTYIKKKLRLSVLEIDDNKRKIVASQKKVLTQEREEREKIFWTHVKPNVIVNGTVKRITNFGAFVSVDGFDCLAHIVDLSWSHIKTVEEVLQKDKSYDFVVLSVDKEKGRVSLGYKQLQPHPYTVALQKHPVGSICKGKVVSIVPFGAFVQIEPGIEGLVHVSESSNNYIKNINEVVKVGDEVDVMVLAVDEQSRRVTLSMKACMAEEVKDEVKEEKSKTDKEWSEDNTNNPFADLLKDVDVEVK